MNTNCDLEVENDSIGLTVSYVNTRCVFVLFQERQFAIRHEGNLPVKAAMTAKCEWQMHTLDIAVYHDINSAVASL